MSLNLPWQGFGIGVLGTACSERGNITHASIAHLHMLQKDQQVWQKFSDLNRNGDGLLSQEEVGAVRPSNSGPSTMAPYFLQRAWAVKMEDISPADKQPILCLEDFVHLLLAWQHRGQPASQARSRRTPQTPPRPWQQLCWHVHHQGRV